MNAAANVAYRAGRWPIQMLALICTLVFVAYVVIIELNPEALPGSLTRSFQISSAKEWSPVDPKRDLSGLKHFVGAPVVLPASAGPALNQYVASVLGSELSNSGEPSSVVLPEAKLSSALEQLRVFELNGQQWELQSAPSWLTYFRFYFARVVDLIKEASYFDITVVSLGWAGMYYTFFHLFFQLRALGSRTFLFFAALLSSSLAFLVAYAITVTAGISVLKLALVQGLPFFVLVVGFNNKVQLARESLLNPEQLSAAEAVKQAVAQSFGRFCRESLIEAGGMLLAGCATKIPGLFEFSIMGVLVLLFDLIFLITFFAANVSLKVAMVQVDRNDAVRRALQEDGVSRDVAGAYADEVLYSSSKARAAKFMHLRWFGGSLRLLLVFGFMAVNWLHIVHFPITFSIHRTDLAAVEIGDFAQRLPLPCVLTVVPALRFELTSSVSLLLNQAWSALRSAPATRVVLLALSISMVFNGYLANVVMHHGSTPPLITHVTPQRSPDATPAPASPQKKLRRKSIVGPAPIFPAPEATVNRRSGDIFESSANNLSRSEKECELVLKEGKAASLSNEELVALSLSGKLPLYALEKQLKDTTRAVVVRRAAVSRMSTTKTLEDSDLPYMDYNYDRVFGACCENVIGYMPIPLGVAGPVIIDGEEFYLPMATTEGVLVASTMRGCKALNAGGGVATEILADGMTRGPCVTFSTASRTARCKLYLDSEVGRKAMEKAFNSTSRFARLDSLKTAQAGIFLYIRFRAQTGDAMGMNMISKGTERALQVLAEECGFEDMTIVSVSGNYCTDKKAAAVNWIEGRGKSVVAEAIIPGEMVRSILKTGVDELVELNMAKNLVGSSVAGVLGGFNAHAANLVAALFLATGQDPAQVVEGSNCMTLMSNVDGDLQISVTMPSLEVGTIGGGTILEPQAAVLNILGVRGPNVSDPGENARKLARIIASAVLAGELSLNSALAAGHLVQSHMTHNRAKPSAK